MLAWTKFCSGSDAVLLWKSVRRRTTRFRSRSAPKPPGFGHAAHRNRPVSVTRRTQTARFRSRSVTGFRSRSEQPHHNCIYFRPFGSLSIYIRSAGHPIACWAGLSIVCWDIVGTLDGLETLLSLSTCRRNAGRACVNAAHKEMLGMENLDLALIFWIFGHVEPKAGVEVCMLSILMGVKAAGFNTGSRVQALTPISIHMGVKASILMGVKASILMGGKASGGTVRACRPVRPGFGSDILTRIY